MLTAENKTPAGRRHFLSVIIPVRNGGEPFQSCLEAIRASDYTDFELVVADDASEDDSAAWADKAGARVIKTVSPSGAATARNRGAAAARGDVFFFTDADVLVAKDTLSKIAAFFREKKEDALIGSYAPYTPAAGYFSKFKNIHHHYVHQISREEAATFWTGCGAITRAAFEIVGGFDQITYSGAMIEDIELGYRLNASGHRIRLLKDLQVVHLKRYNLWTLVISDVFYRAVPWTRLMISRKYFRSDLNTTPRNAISVLLSLAIIAFLAATPLEPWFLIAAGFALALFAVNTLTFTRYVKRYFGGWFAAATVFMSVLYFFYAGAGCGLGIAAAVWDKLTKRTARLTVPATP